MNLTVVLAKGTEVKKMLTANPSLKDVGEIERYGEDDITKYVDLRLFMINTKMKNCSHVKEVLA